MNPGEAPTWLARARLLAAEGKLREAGQLIVESLPHPAPPALVLEACGLLRRSGDPLAGAKLAASHNLWAQAGEAFLEARLPRDAADAWLRAALPVHAASALAIGREHARALTLLLEVEPTSPWYADAAERVVPLALGLNRRGDDVRQFLGPFMAAPARSAEARRCQLQAAEFLATGVRPAQLQAPTAPIRATDAAAASAPASESTMVRPAPVDVLGETRTIAKPVISSDAPTDTGTSKTHVTGDGRPKKEAPQVDPEGFFAAEAVVARRYRLEKKIGSGGMAAVFEAHDLELDERIALKVFSQSANGTQALLDFREELKLTRQLTHPNIVKVFDLGEHEGFKFLTMELLKGTDLKHLVKQPLAIDLALGLLSQICAGLGAAHQQGVIHRDVKPHNLFVTRDGPLKVMDFGIARRTSVQGVASGTVAGTPDYLPPEQVHHFEGVGPTADLYSLGVVMFEMFTGQLPFQAGDVRTLVRMHLEKPAPAPSTVNPYVPPELDEIVLKLMDKSPARRFQSCRELAAALEPIRRQHAFDGL